ncbi:MAG: sulfatase [Opitutales bacterium]
MRELLVLLSFGWALAVLAQEAPLNIIVIYTDDQGYADLGCYGSDTIATPHLDRLAAEGARLTDFYASAPVCTPSRAGLLTGCYPARLGLQRGVIFPQHNHGLNPAETTIAEVLAPLGYASMAIGKWHLGHQKELLPQAQGFDQWFGIPYSNDMGVDWKHNKNAALKEHWKRHGESWKTYPVPLMRGSETVENPADQRTLTRRYTDEAVSFIETNAAKPFFLYLAHSMPHIPLYVAPETHDADPEDAYRLTIAEIDASTGRIREALAAAGIEERTLLIFTSDNGPWLSKQPFAGSADPLQGGKQSTREGGMRVPGIIWAPGHVPAGQTLTQLAAQIDLLPTIAEAAGAPLLQDQQIDGISLWPLLTNAPQAESRETFLYYNHRNGKAEAIR